MRAFLNRIRSLFSRARLDHELREEMEGHIERRRQALIDEGLDPAAAAAEARRTFGNATVLRERTRALWSCLTLESIAQDVRYGARRLRAAPVFTSVAVLSMAAGLTAGLGVFTFMNAVILRPLGFGEGERIYRVYTQSDSGQVYGGSAYPDYLAFTAAPGLFEATCATARVRTANLETDARAQMQSGELFSPDCFAALKLRPHAGRFFDPGSLKGGEPQIVISYRLWAGLFAADPGAVGRALILNGHPATVVAVAPRGFAGTSLDDSADFWVPTTMAATVFPADVLAPGQGRFAIFARLAAGVTSSQAEAALAGTAAGLRAENDRLWTTAAGATRRVTVARELDARFGQSPGEVLDWIAVSLAAIGSVIALACLNLATMMLARGAARGREIAVRLALGASRGRVLRQLVTESLIISTAAAALALGAVAAGLRVFEANKPAGMPAFDIAVDWRVATFAVFAAFLAAIAFGLSPAAHAVRIAVADGLKGRARVVRLRWLRFGAREALIVTQVTASIALLLVAALFAQGLRDAAGASPGFTTSGVTVVPVDLEAAATAMRPALTEKVLDAAGRVEGVARPVLAAVIPLTGTNLQLEIRPDGGEPVVLLANLVSPGYFEMLGIGRRTGRGFTDADRSASQRVAIVSEKLATSLWPGLDAVGRMMSIGGESTEVVGVVADIRYRALTEPFRPIVYLPIAQMPHLRFYVHAHVRDGQAMVALERAIRSVDPRLAVKPAMPLAARLDDALIGERLTQWIGGGAGIAQFGLALMALWSLVAYAVERRTTEMGIRLALGATPAGLVQLALRPALVLITAGAALGIGAGLAGATTMQSTFPGLAGLRAGRGASRRHPLFRGCRLRRVVARPPRRICGSCRRPEERGMNAFFYCSRPRPRIIVV